MKTKKVIAFLMASGLCQGNAAGTLPVYAAAPMLRTEFETKADVDSARLYPTTQGIYDFYLNGQKVAPEEWFNPGATEYNQILTYNVYDVTEIWS